MTRRAVVIPVGMLVLVAVAGASGLAGFRLGRDAERAASRVSASGVPAEPSEAASRIAADVGPATTVLVSGMRFQPEVIRVKAGESVAWTFNDPGVIHSVTAVGGGFDSGPQAAGTFAVRFDTPGTYCYICKPHPGRNLCERGAEPAAGPRVLAATPLRAVATLLNLSGGRPMQGMVIVQE